MDQRHRVTDALEDLTRAVSALGDALRESGVLGDPAAEGPEIEVETDSNRGVPFVPILVPMEVLQAWGALAPGSGDRDVEEAASDAASPSPAPGASPVAATVGGRRGPAPADESAPPTRGTWVWTWEHPTSEGERIEDEIEGGT